MSSAILDIILIPMRNPLIWIPLYVFLIAFYLLNYEKKGYWMLLFTILAVATSDMLSSKVIKPLFGRLRPCNDDLLAVVERVGCGSGFSFTSSHATNHFALAVFVSIILNKELGKYKYLVLFWAAVISISQVYVGLHFPLDITMGGTIGSTMGFMWSRIYKKSIEHLIPNVA